MTHEERTERTLATVEPELAAKVRLIFAAMRALGFVMVATDGLRSTAQQVALHKQGRSTPGRIVTHLDGVTKRSQHQDGRAVDVCFATLHGDGFQPMWTGPWEAVGACAEALGLIWGGRFRIRDRPHVELP